MRVTGIGERLITRSPRGMGALVRAGGGGALGLGLVARAGMGDLRLRLCGRGGFRVLRICARRPARCCWCWPRGRGSRRYIGATVGEIGFLRGFWMDGSRRLAWLEDYAASVAASGDLPVPDGLQQGIRLEHVSFAYPGTSRVVLDDVSLTLPAGAVVAIVGENGAGKTTLVKLLAKMYEPSSGSILVDDTPLARVPAAEWRARLAGAFQDFFRFEFRARHTVGLGDVPRLDDEPAVVAAVDRAGAADVVARLAVGARHPTRSHLAERSGAILRPVAEAGAGARLHARSATVADSRRADRRARRGNRTRLVRALRRRRPAATTPAAAITILVSHRFSTVRMADLIVVLDGARLVEVGTHEELMAKRGQYAELYGIQAAAYR